MVLGEFLLNVTPLTKKSKKKSPKDHVEHMKKFLVSLDSSLEQETHAIYLHFCAWISRMESSLASNNWFKNHQTKDYEESLNFRSKLLMSG